MTTFIDLLISPLCQQHSFSLRNYKARELKPHLCSTYIVTVRKVGGHID
jgi:hypothetical protein